MTNVYSAIPIYKRFFWPNPVVRFPLLWRKLIVGYNYEVTGQQNPATCAMAALQAAGFDVDKASFDAVASRFTMPFAGGLLIASLDDIAKLCALGDFVIYQREGIIYCATVEEGLKP